MENSLNNHENVNGHQLSSSVINLQSYNNRLSDNLSNNNISNLSIEQINEQLKYILNVIVQKYWFNWFESNIFRNWLTIKVNQMEPGYESNFWLSNTYIIQGDIYPKCDVYINNKLIPNTDFYFATLFHEIDHYAFNLKKLFIKNLSNAHPNERQSIIGAWARENDTDAYQFCTELMARIDTANELMVQGISRNEVWSYWPWNEHWTTGERHYTDSIKYAQKFLKFQIGLYNLLACEFWLNSHKRKNQQLSDQAYWYFETIMNALRDVILESSSINNCKNAIDSCNNKLQTSESRNDFCHKMGLIS